MYTTSIKVLQQAVTYNGIIHFENLKIKYEVGPDLEWIPPSNNDVLNAIKAIQELVSLGYLKKLGKNGSYDHIYSITQKGREYWSELSNMN
ncbi:hypothetical protein [Vibrio cyclitrophicus]|uniref:hypothetical protein n=1 Tax=Vibrio cyclitrophicus TaxID=47951 RepID=UPI00037E40B9|nr:hypothetical protein [Vibrio cyclitrophicus]OEE44137.1 hypothetical protein OAG_05650 [Vibrio cyclitrophicus FF75]